ncbi:restriction endonuclease subunit S [Enterobacter mori]|uniref:restriction endonuclease subunit S n=1 Tax=Enterobacter mori TaxID=539813 RepID=UPI002235DB92|nr:restriction endonuclease subunit S [Enterobacter mori]MCW4987908.1 restriction endonuclease subunit S [Enterobacter mori]
MTVEKLITDHIDIWSSALQTRSTAGRGSNGKIDLYGIKKLRELILELAVRGKLVPQDPNDEPASELLKRIAAEKAELVKQGKIKKQKPLPEISEDEKPFELPVGWEWGRVGDIAIFTNGFAFKSSDFKDDGVGIVKIGDIDSAGFISTENMSYVDQSVVENLPLDLEAEPGCLVIAMSGATTGKLGFNTTNKIFFLNQRVGKISPLLMNKYYLYYYLSTKIAENLSISMGSAIPNISTIQINNIIIPLPSEREQQIIVDKINELIFLCDQLEQQSLTSLDAHQQLVETLLATLTDSQNAEELAENWVRISQHFDTLFTTEASIDALKQTILQLAVMGKLVPQDPNDEPASELLKRIEQEKAQLVKEGKIKKQKPLPSVSDEEKSFELPDGWEWTTMQGLYPEFQNGLSSRGSSSGKDSVVIRLADIKNWKVSFADTRAIAITDSEKQKYCLDKNDILIVRVNGSADIVGGFVLYDDDQNVCYCDHFIRLRLPYKRVIDENYLILVASSPLIRRKINNLFITTAGQKTVNQTHISSLLFPLPPYKEQKCIVARVNELFSLCEQLKLRLQSAHQTQLNLADALTDAALN